MGQQLFDEVVLAWRQRSLLSDEHFTVDGTLIEAALRPSSRETPAHQTYGASLETWPETGFAGWSAILEASRNSEG